MRRQRTGIRQSMAVVPALIAGCFTFGLAARATAECTTKTYTMTLPDRATLKLADGEHGIGSVQTEHGRLEVRVTVKGKEISAPHFVIGGRPLREVSEAALAQGLRDCLKTVPASSSTSETWVAKAVRSALDWLVVPAQAKTTSYTWAEGLVFTELCFKGTNATQTCTYKACFTDLDTGKKTCYALLTI